MKVHMFKTVRENPCLSSCLSPRSGARPDTGGRYRIEAMLSDLPLMPQMPLVARIVLKRKPTKTVLVLPVYFLDPQAYHGMACFTSTTSRKV
eukprot:5348487-Pleurochrysis_carterae.AAC.1